MEYVSSCHMVMYDKRYVLFSINATDYKLTHLFCFLFNHSVVYMQMTGEMDNTLERFENVRIDRQKVFTTVSNNEQGRPNVKSSYVHLIIDLLEEIGLSKGQKIQLSNPSENNLNFEELHNAEKKVLQIVSLKNCDEAMCLLYASDHGGLKKAVFGYSYVKIISDVTED